jgi:tetratricopeptide (TPR) repeat protein
MTGESIYFDVDDIISLINYFLDNKDIGNLNKVIELGFALHTDDLDFSLAISETLIEMNQYDDAWKILNEIVDEDDEDVDLLKINCLFGMDRYDDGMKIVYKLIHEQSPQTEEILVQIAQWLNETDGWHERAFDFINNSLALYPDNFQLKTQLCFYYEKLGDTKKAIDMSKALVEENPFAAEIWYLLARQHVTCLNYDKAIEALDFAAASAQDDLNLQYEIQLSKAWCLSQNGSYIKADECFDDLKSYQEFDFVDVNPLAAKNCMAMEDYEKAYNLLEPLKDIDDLDKHTDSVAVLGDLIVCCIETERRDDAIRLMLYALKNYPHEILEYLSNYKLFSTQKDEAPQDDDDIVFPEELTRLYLSHNFNNN